MGVLPRALLVASGLVPQVQSKQIRTASEELMKRATADQQGAIKAIADAAEKVRQAELKAESAAKEAESAKERSAKEIAAREELEKLANQQIAQVSAHALNLSPARRVFHPDGHMWVGTRRSGKSWRG